MFSKVLKVRLDVPDAFAETQSCLLTANSLQCFPDGAFVKIADDAAHDSLWLLTTRPLKRTV